MPSAHRAFFSHAEGKAVQAFTATLVGAFLLAFTPLSPVTMTWPLWLAYWAVTLALTRVIANGGAFTEHVSLAGKTVVVTGGNAGIGKASAVYFASWGARVVIACRSLDLGREAVKAIKAQAKLPDSSQNVTLLQLDLADLKSVENFANEFKSRVGKLDILLNNAGVMQCPFSKTKDGFEMQFGTNHIGHFKLTNLLLPLLMESGGRVVNVSSLGHNLPPPLACAEDFNNLNEAQYGDGMTAYGASKLANVLFTRELNRRLVKAKSKATAYSCHPGFCATELGRHYPKFVQLLLTPLVPIILKNCVQGCQTSLYCCLSASAKPGLYHADCAESPMSAMARSDALAADLWAYSERVTGLAGKCLAA